MLLTAQLSVGVRSEPDTGNRIRKGGEWLPKARSDMPPSSGILKFRCRSTSGSSSPGCSGGERVTPAFHQTHIVMHEIAHVLLGHRGRAPAWQGVARLLAPDLDPALIRLILGRGTYGAKEEEDAETLASLILQQPGNPVSTITEAGCEDARAFGRLQHVWGRGSRQAA